ncbi:receptor-like protein kinase FERONIA-like [Hibiscus syriacus]|uniref:Receptor-like protein kinase FERONIA-like n=1 Tax=Hibiscus syriacus TaxID=106335 RepID=A0A6A2YKZ3_HIBSY|nr:receptor-like protein kinase FERONIA-like [Hibiscus syriacus]
MLCDVNILVDKPLVLKELRKLWDRQLPNIPWKKGEYNESNTLLLDDSPNAAIFPYPYQYTDAADCSLAPEGDLRKYLERLAEAENVQQFIEQIRSGNRPSQRLIHIGISIPKS